MCQISCAPTAFVDAIAPIVLTMRLLPLIKKSNARVVMVSSIAHGMAGVTNTAIPKEVAAKAMAIAGDICIYSNQNVTLLSLPE